MVSQKTMLSLGMLNKVMKPDKNYKEYREALRAVTPPCVPFLGMFTRHLAVSQKLTLLAHLRRVSHGLDIYRRR